MNRTPGDWVDAFIKIDSKVFSEELFLIFDFTVCYGQQFVSGLHGCLNYVLVLVNFAAEVEVRHRRTFL